MLSPIHNTCITRHLETLIEKFNISYPTTPATTPHIQDYVDLIQINTDIVTALDFYKPYSCVVNILQIPSPPQIVLTVKPPVTLASTPVTTQSISKCKT